MREHTVDEVVAATVNGTDDAKGASALGQGSDLSSSATLTFASSAEPSIQLLARQENSDPDVARLPDVVPQARQAAQELPELASLPRHDGQPFCLDGSNEDVPDLGHRGHGESDLDKADLDAGAPQRLPEIHNEEDRPTIASLGQELEDCDAPMEEGTEHEPTTELGQDAVSECQQADLTDQPGLCEKETESSPKMELVHDNVNIRGQGNRTSLEVESMQDPVGISEQEELASWKRKSMQDPVIEWNSTAETKSLWAVACTELDETQESCMEHAAATCDSASFWIDATTFDLIRNSESPAPTPAREGTVHRELLAHHVWELCREHESLLLLADEQAALSRLQVCSEIHSWTQRARALRSKLPGATSWYSEENMFSASKEAADVEATILSCEAQAAAGLHRFQTLAAQLSELKAGGRSEPVPSGSIGEGGSSQKSTTARLLMERAGLRQRIAALEAQLEELRLEQNFLRPKDAKTSGFSATSLGGVRQEISALRARCLAGAAAARARS
eukprot:TRINITY_DN27550_c0_g1_i2.p1 TRINITY_DN27550_c0_g1~~TRINITY_DN27550_c0_g1_i2.p1  ORF type:complete len:507 (-),score=112.86 TRINITY_DN27550_c0_g1_i2:30-1550(-)